MWRFGRGRGKLGARKSTSCIRKTSCLRWTAGLHTSKLGLGTRLQVCARMAPSSGTEKLNLVWGPHLVLLGGLPVNDQADLNGLLMAKS